MGALAARLRQPRVVGEIAAGILLRPSLLGRIAPDLSAVILGAGLELGVLTAPVYSMMVLMALVTTAMATPVLQALGPSRT